VLANVDNVKYPTCNLPILYNTHNAEIQENNETVVCEIFYWRDVTACFTMTYCVKNFDVFAILSER